MKRTKTEVVDFDEILQNIPLERHTLEPRPLAKREVEETRKLMRNKLCLRCGAELPRGWKEPFCFNCKHRFGGPQIIFQG